MASGEAKPHSELWVLSGFIFCIFGGVISYLYLRDKNHELARRCLYSGMIFTAVWLFIAVSAADTFSESIGKKVWKYWMIMHGQYEDWHGSDHTGGYDRWDGQYYGEETHKNFPRHGFDSMRQNGCYVQHRADPVMCGMAPNEMISQFDPWLDEPCTAGWRHWDQGMWSQDQGFGFCSKGADRLQEWSK